MYQDGVDQALAHAAVELAEDDAEDDGADHDEHEPSIAHPRELSPAAAAASIQDRRLPPTGRSHDGHARRTRPAQVSVIAPSPRAPETGRRHGHDLNPWRGGDTPHQGASMPPVRE
jgi:hypothetical protein